jgi:hypothetical protein
MHNLIIQLLDQTKEIASSSYEHLFFMNIKIMLSRQLHRLQFLGLCPSLKPMGNLANCNSPEFGQFLCRNPTLAKCGGEAQHLEKLGIWSPPGLPNV